jgi:hypothetical protein
MNQAGRDESNMQGWFIRGRMYLFICQSLAERSLATVYPNTLPMASSADTYILHSEKRSSTFFANTFQCPSGLFF